ncbi:DUF3467 domain-containing protein [Cryomorphaceae bacterium 1068]|nr:DUF3467 domain-containing protein [Cryomorphaceae bacterium 1068]
MADQNQNKDQKKNQLNIELKEDVADGIYSNLAIITHSNAEFVADFIRVMPGMPKARVKARIVLTPQHAKRLMRALQDNIQKFESVHGKISDSNPNDGGGGFPMNFGGPTAQA